VPPMKVPKLTNRERTVLELVGEGRLNKEIALQLDVSKSHIEKCALVVVVLVAAAASAAAVDDVFLFAVTAVAALFCLYCRRSSTSRCCISRCS